MTIEILTNLSTWEIVSAFLLLLSGGISGGTIKHFMQRVVLKQLIDLLDSTQDTNSSIKDQAAKNKYINAQKILNKYLN